MKVAVLFAAGLSKRFHGPNKLLMPYRDRPLIGWSAEAFGKVAVDHRILLTGRDNSLTVEAVRSFCPSPFEICHNPAPEDGFASSARLALRACPLADWTVLMLADMPDVTADIVHHLFEATEPDAYAVVPAFVGTWGNPLILSAEAAGDVAGVADGISPLSALQARRKDVAVAPMPTDAILRDIDKPSDLLMPEDIARYEVEAVDPSKAPLSVL